MDLPWGDEKTVKFITNVGLITSDGPVGPNIMSAEWTHHISYSPGLIAICLGKGKATLENIRKSREFGVNIASVGQAVMASVSGNHSGRDVDKIGLLKELGFKFYKGRKIRALMVEDAALNAECKLLKEIELGDHIMMVGEVAEASAGGQPLAYHQGLYWRLDKPLDKVSETERAKIRGILDKFRRT